MVKSASFLLLYPIPQGRAYIYKNVCNHFYIPIYFLVIATSPNHIPITLTLMELAEGIGPTTYRLLALYTRIALD